MRNNFACFMIILLVLALLACIALPCLFFITAENLGAPPYILRLQSDAYEAFPSYMSVSTAFLYLRHILEYLGAALLSILSFFSFTLSENCIIGGANLLKFCRLLPESRLRQIRTLVLIQ